MITIGIVILALLLDRILGEPRRFHPLVAFGVLATAIEHFNESVMKRFVPEKLCGLICWLILVVPPTVLSWLVLEALPIWWNYAFEILILYFTIGWRSMQQHAMAVYEPLRLGDIEQARASVRLIVSRDTEKLGRCDIAKGTVESVLENGNDCLFSSIYWFLLLGAPGALLFRLANTLDAMWGHKTERYLQFGWATAKIDDLLGWIPARLTAIGYALAGRFSDSLACMRNQVAPSEGPNAGLVMAAGAGALGIQLGGPTIYNGQVDRRPELGCGRKIEIEDIIRSLGLVHRTLAWWLIVLITGSIAIGLISQLLLN